MTEPLRVHPFHHGGYRNWRGEAICECGSVRNSRVHELKERTEDEREVEARKVGEAGGFQAD